MHFECECWMKNRWKKCILHPIQSDGNTMFHCIFATLQQQQPVPTELMVYTLHTQWERRKTKQKCEFTQRDTTKNAEQIVRQRIQLLRKASERHRNRLVMYEPRASAAAAGFDRNLYVTRSRSKFCETTTTLSVEGYGCQVSEVFGCVTRGSQHQAAGTIHGGCRPYPWMVCTKWKMLVLYQRRKIFLYIYIDEFFSSFTWLVAAFAIIWTIWNVVQYGNRHFAMATAVNRFLFKSHQGFSPLNRLAFILLILPVLVPHQSVHSGITFNRPRSAHGRRAIASLELNINKNEFERRKHRNEMETKRRRREKTTRWKMF